MTIRAVREAKKLRQVDVCSEGPLSLATLRTAEKFGAHAVSRESLERIAKVLGVPAEDLLAGEMPR